MRFYPSLIFYHKIIIFVEWSGEVRSITYSADAKSVSVVYRVTLYGTDAEVGILFAFQDMYLLFSIYGVEMNM